MQRLCRFGFFAVAVMASMCMVEVCAASAQEDSKVHTEVIASLQKGAQTTRVIVHLDAPAGATAPLRPDSEHADQIRRAINEPLVHNAIESIRDRVAPDDLVRIRTFRLQPAFAATVSQSGLEALVDDPQVLSIQPDRVFFANTLEGLEMIGADDLQQHGFSGAGTAVAIIDSGIDYLHPTLGGGTIPNAKIIRGLDTGDGDGDPMDCGAHGTAVASVAAGTSYQWNPQQRFSGGVAPQARILAYKASPDANCGAFSQSAVIEAIEDAILHRNGDDYTLAAINLSFGTGLFVGPCDQYTSSFAIAVAAATQAGIAVVASAGNQGHPDSLAAPACIADTISVGSVWDTDSGLLAYSFCLDESCTTTCNDSFRPTGAVSCYSNSGAVLDLLAPAEFLKAARAGGQIIQFGGTSGAAAYVTGALALIRQAAPDLEPGAARRLLQLSGLPTLDHRTGRVRPRMNLPRAVDQVDSIRSPDTMAVPIPNTGATGIESSLEVAGSGTVGSVQVLLHVSHPAPDQLEIALQSPDGTRVRLHDHGPGSIEGLGGTEPWTGGIWGLFPDELQPVDSLGHFGGIPMTGTWRLEVTDTIPGSDSDLPGHLVGWALSISPEEAPSADHGSLLSIPVVANAPGERETMWNSEVRIFNPTPGTAILGRLYFVPESPVDEFTEFRQTVVTIPEGSILDLPDVVTRRFALPNRRGSLHLQTDHEGPVMTSRTFTGNAETGTYGQYIGDVDPGQSVAVGEPSLVLLHLTDTADFRTNLGLTELDGQQVTLRVTLYDGDSGLPVGNPLVYSVDGFSNRQVRLELGGTDQTLYAVVEAVAGEGRATVYASIVDNQTGDAVFVPGVRPTAIDTLVVPVVAKQLGQAGTDWRTDLVVANLDNRVVTLDLEFRPRQGSAGEFMTTEAELDPGTVLDVHDAILDLFGLTRAVGSLRILFRDGAATATASSRIYNQTPEGSYGQFVPAVSIGSGSYATAIHIDSTNSARTNIGLCEIGGGTVQIRCTVSDEFGRLVGQPLLLTAEAFQLIQVNDIFAAVGASETANARVNFEQLSGDGEWMGYASVIDHLTGDAIFVPALPAGQ